MTETSQLEYGDLIVVEYEGEEYEASVLRTKMIFGEPRVEVVSGPVETWFHFDDVCYIKQKFEDRKKRSDLPMLGERLRLADGLPMEAKK